MRKLLCIVFVFAMSIGLINAQNCLGKNKVQAKKEVYSKLAPKIFTPIKSFGYDGYSYSSNFRDSFFLFFNDNGICFLECLITNDKKFIDNALFYYCNNDNYEVYQSNPTVNKEHKFIEGIISLELVVEANNPAMINTTYNLWSFKSEYKQDVINYFEKKYSK